MDKKIESKTSPIRRTNQISTTPAKSVKAKAGPKTIDDEASLMEMAKLILAKKVKSDHEAATIVAENANGQSVEATSKRLYRKFRESRQLYLDNAIQLPLMVAIALQREADLMALQIIQDSNMEKCLYNERIEKELLPWGTKVKNILSHLIESGKDWDLVAYCVPVICDAVWNGQEVSQEMLEAKERHFLGSRPRGQVSDIVNSHLALLKAKANCE